MKGNVSKTSMIFNAVELHEFLMITASSNSQEVGIYKVVVHESLYGVEFSRINFQLL